MTRDTNTANKTSLHPDLAIISNSNSAFWCQFWKPTLDDLYVLEIGDELLLLFPNDADGCFDSVSHFSEPVAKRYRRRRI